MRSYTCRSKILDNQTEPYQDYGGEWHIQGIDMPLPV